jgi:predicted O-linked N-acetylglucosamine transferase (SPINDLY family)
MGIIYDIIESKQDLSRHEKDRQLKLHFLNKIKNIRQLTKNRELDNYSTTMGILFQHLKKDILNILIEIVPESNKNEILSYQTNNIEWNKKLFDILYKFGFNDVIMWWFFHIPYFNDWNSEYQKEEERKVLIEMLKYTYYKWSESNYFTEKEFVYMSNQTCLMYPITYQNTNNNQVLKLYSKLLRKICPWLKYTSPNIGDQLLIKMQKDNIIDCKNKEINKKKICFITDSFIVDSCVFRDRIGLIGQLMKEDKLDIHVASFYEKKHITGDIAKIFITKIKNNYIHLDRDLNLARTKIDTYNFDIIIYPDIGMKLYPYLLSYSRLAPIQINTWGHSETSGIDTIDYFISSKFFHPYQKLVKNEIQEEFSEKIVLMNSLSTYYLPPTKMFNIDITKFKTKKELGYPDHINIYGCLQTSYKITRNFENMLLNILKFDPNSYIILSNAIPFCQSHLKRFKNIFGPYLQRIRWYPALDKFHYLELVNHCTVILDPFPFGGCNTSFEAFDLNIPVITYPSQYLSGNFTTGLYKKMGITDCIVDNEKDYYLKAIQISNKPKLRNKITRDINNNKIKIFLEKESVEDWKKFLFKV